MCLAIPGKIIHIDNSIDELKMAKVDFGGIQKDICIQWVEAGIGEYVLVHAGMALCKVDTQEALQTIDDFETIARHLEDQDKKSDI